jgi:predicted nuclease of predicted toxin-antitoxin system
LRILLDENLDWRLGQDLPGHQVESVPLIGWAGMRNGLLLDRAQEQFDIFITMDSNMVREQNIGGLRIAIIALKARSNRLADTRPLMNKILELLPTLGPGTLTTLST